MRREVGKAAPWRPVVYVSVDDVVRRKGVVDALQRLGWTVIEQASGFHILSALADVIEKDGANGRVGMIVVDEISRGCSGTTLARGLRDLGCSIPVVLVRPGTTLDEIADQARPLSPISILQPAPMRARASA
ncbi:MAG TPA: response regulator [Kofleriaceae bacterium]|nr:response regulator [Kofleriaceae bacterium]